SPTGSQPAHGGAPKRPASPPTLHVLARGAPLPVTELPAGVSVEYPLMAQFLGGRSCPSAALVEALRSLGSPPIRLGGNSQDLTAPSGASFGALAWNTATLYTLPAAFWGQLHCLLSATGDPLEVGLNASYGGLPWAQLMVAGARSAATNGVEFSLGNEPDLYYLPNYSSLGTSSLNEGAAVSLYVRVAASLREAVGSAPVIGPEPARASTWRPSLPRLIGEVHLATVGVHLYPLSECHDPAAVTEAALLAPSAGDAPLSLAWVATDAGAFHLPAIISEANSASCGGKPGVSDTPAAGVWALRFVLSALTTGFREVRFHFSGGVYDPFVVHGESVAYRPLYSALKAINEWVPVGATVQPATGVTPLSAVVVRGHSPGASLILNNPEAKAETVLLPAARALRVEVMSPSWAGVHSTELAPEHGRVKLTLEADSVLAVVSPTY
ncbi:MAG: hypothetical protein KGJ43_08555, partial [Acidobacteriota bacterium]|nr:hypothetical protein [Acidobacteriota bacterium]